MSIKMKKTARGFSIGTFEDLYGHQCSIQKSSLATQDAIWLGIDDADPQIMASQAKQFGVETSETCGWVPYPIPEEVSLTTRMHLNKEQATMLIQKLKIFVETGEV
jgi:hypothetical protein